MGEPRKEDGWKRVATDPPSTASTLIWPLELTDGDRIWPATKNTIPPEDAWPLWWRFKKESP